MDDGRVTRILSCDNKLLNDNLSLPEELLQGSWKGICVPLVCRIPTLRNLPITGKNATLVGDTLTTNYSTRQSECLSFYININSFSDVQLTYLHR